MAAEPFILCENLIKIYRLDDGSGAAADSTEVQALQGLDLVVERGEMVGVIGASGSGKSTLMNILGGLDRPTGGRAYVDGKDLGRMNQAALDRYRRTTVGFVWQQGSRNLIPYLSAAENVRLPLTLCGRVGKKFENRPAELLETVELGERIHHRLEELSGGEQQRVAIAIALANEPSLLLADEPTGELDTVTAAKIYELLRRLNKTMNLTIVIVSHDRSIAGRVDRVVAVRDGKLASETVRRSAAGEQPGAHHMEELAVLDGAGRLQIPRDYLEQFHIRRRVRVEVTPEGILLRPTEHDKAAAETAAPAAAEPGRPAGGSEWESMPVLPVLVGLLKKPLPFVGRFLRRLRDGAGGGSETKDGKA